MAPRAPYTRPVDIVSVAAFTTGLLMLGPVPLALGIWGRRRTKDRAGVGGHGMATWGFFLGLFETVVWVFVLFAWLLVRAEQATTF